MFRPGGAPGPADPVATIVSETTSSFPEGGAAGLAGLAGAGGGGGGGGGKVKLTTYLVVLPHTYADHLWLVDDFDGARRAVLTDGKFVDGRAPLILEGDRKTSTSNSNSSSSSSNKGSSLRLRQSGRNLDSASLWMCPPLPAGKGLGLGGGGGGGGGGRGGEGETASGTSSASPGVANGVFDRYDLHRTTMTTTARADGGGGGGAAAARPAEPAPGATFELVKAAGPPRDVPLAPSNKPREPTMEEWRAAANYTIRLQNPPTPPSPLSSSSWSGSWSGSGPSPFDDSAKDGIDVILAVDYVGDAARLYLGDRLLTDNWFSGYAAGPVDPATGDPTPGGGMQLGLTQLDDEHGGRLLQDGAALTLLVLPLKKASLEDNIFLQRRFWPDYRPGVQPHLVHNGTAVAGVNAVRMVFTSHLTAAAVAASAPPAPPHTDGGGGGLPAGATAGIVIACAAVAGFAGGLFLYRRARLSRGGSAGNAPLLGTGTEGWSTARSTAAAAGYAEQM
eukprot:g3902.t1